MTTFRPYLAYKRSDIEWLGDIPRHWNVLRAKHVLQSIDVRSATGDEELLSVSETDGVVPRSEKNITMFMAESYVGHKLCWPDDLVVNSLWAWKNGLGVSQHHGIVSSAYGVYRRRNGEVVDPRFLHLSLRSPLYDWELHVRSKGIWISRLQLTDESFLDMPLLLPPLDEQRAIAGFLDAMDERVNRFIDSRRRMIALLEEQKQAVITQAVTKGLDPDAPMKPSGIEWLGDIPAQWEVRRLKDLANVQTGLTLGKVYGNEPLEERPYLRVANVQAGYLALDTVTTVRVPKPEIERTSLQHGDVLMTEGGDIDKLGRGALWSGEIDGCLHQNHVFAVRPERSRLIPEYLVQLMASSIGRSYFQLTAKQTTNLAATNSTTLKEFAFPLPPGDEQDIVLAALDTESRRIARLIARQHREIELIQEYRTRLISDVVTGKLDVRGATRRETGRHGVGSSGGSPGN